MFGWGSEDTRWKQMSPASPSWQIFPLSVWVYLKSAACDCPPMDSGVNYPPQI